MVIAVPATAHRPADAVAMLRRAATAHDAAAFRAVRPPGPVTATPAGPGIVVETLASNDMVYHYG